MEPVDSSPKPVPVQRVWRDKFSDAIRGILVARRGDKSFAVHQIAIVLVIVAGIVLQIDRVDWCLLILSMSSVLAAETFNSSIESLAKFVTSEHDERIGRSLDMAAGAVLLIAIGAACIGLVVFVPRIISLL